MFDTGDTGRPVLVLEAYLPEAPIGVNGSVMRGIHWRRYAKGPAIFKTFCQISDAESMDAGAIVEYPDGQVEVVHCSNIIFTGNVDIGPIEFDRVKLKYDEVPEGER